MFSTKLFVIFTTIPILLSSALIKQIVKKSSHGDVTTWTESSHNNNSGNCMGDDFIKCYENILEYVTLGEEKITISDEKKAVIVIGLTRVGKSTLTQFVANDTNPLFVSCAGTICRLIDDSGDGANTVVSKTFVPNTVEDNITNGVLTPFYDMPGFDDTRNISVEIANSFFIQKVVHNIEQIKIVVVAKHAGFSATETTFKTLLTFLIKLAKDPNKFRDSIVIISNFGSYTDDDAAHFYNMREYMVAYNESMYGEESSHPDPEERATATAWINCFLDAPDEAPENLKRAAIFRTPGSRLNGKSIRNDSVYQEDYVRMKQLLYNDTLFTPVSSNDIGFTLSIEAELFLERATRESDTSIRNSLSRFASKTKSHLKDVIERMTVTPNKEEMTKLHTYITTLQRLSFADCNNLPASSPRECINQIEKQFSSISTDMDDSTFTDINKTTNYLQFAFENIGKEKEYNMEDWVNGVISVGYDTDVFLNNTARDVAAEISSSFRKLANDAHMYILTEFEKLATSQLQSIQILNDTVSEVLNIEHIVECSENSPNSPISCYAEIIEKTKLLRELTSNNVENELLPLVKFLNLTCSEITLCVGLKSWVWDLAAVKSMVVGSLDEQSIPQNIFDILLAQLTDVALRLKSEILHDVPNSSSIRDLLTHLSNKKNAAEETTRLLETYNSRESLRGYATVAVGAYRDLFNASMNGVVLDGIYVLERVKIFPWYSPVWINFHRDSLTLPILLEWRVSKFQSILFKNLGSSNVQVDEIEKFLQWRKDNPTLVADNFDEFWDKFEGLGIEAMRSFSEYRDDIKGHICNNEYSRNWVNVLLDYTIKRDQISCPTVQSGVAKFERKYLTLKYVYDCLTIYENKPNRIVALAENTFFFDVDFENLGISNKFKVFVMSQNFDYTRGMRTTLNLNGTDGALPNPLHPPTPPTAGANGTDGIRGEDGRAAADFIGVYLTDIGKPGDVTITCNGGKGGNGQNGGNGADAESTRGPGIGLNDDGDLAFSLCSAWDSGDKIQVKKFPNSCNYDLSGFCNVGSWVTICGDKPMSPGFRGMGGPPGVGGSGGIKVILNVTSSTPAETNFPAGSDGIKGNDGNDGGKGKWGASRLKIGDRYCWGCVERVCNAHSSIDTNYECHVPLVDKIQESHTSPSLLVDTVPLQLENRRNSEKYSVTASNKTVVYSLDEFKPYVKILLDNSLKSLNIFNRPDVARFLDFVKSNPLLV